MSQGPTQRQLLTTLPIDDCLALLASQRLGRVAFDADGDLEIMPVNYVYDRGTVLLRTGAGSKLTAAVAHRRAAFEVDGYDAERGWGWSVVVKGRLEEVWRPSELERVELLSLRPAAPGPRPHVVRIVPGSITGRAIHADPDQVDLPLADEPAHAAPA